MSFLGIKIRKKAQKYSCGLKRKSKIWRRMAGTALCVVLLSTNIVGVLAAEVPDETSKTEISFTEEEIGHSPEGASDLETSEQAPESSGETGEEEPSTPSDADIAEDTPPTESSAPPTDEDGELPENAEDLDVHVAAWTWVDDEKILTEYEGAWVLSLPGANKQDLTEELLLELLPKEIRATLSNGEEIVLPLTWNLSSLADIAADPEENYSDAAEKFYRFDAAVGGDYALADGALSPYVRFSFGGAEVYAGVYPGTRRPLLNGTDNLASHTVQGITPAGTTVNLFDYDFGITDDDDVLPNGAKFEDYSNGINAGALLLFGGSAMREAGFWNQGSGAGRPWGKLHTNMKGIVQDTLVDEYPYINLGGARGSLPDATGTPSDDWGNSIFMDVANLNHAEYENAGVDKARALSEKLLKSRGLTVSADGKVSGTCEKASLSYLFDPDTTTGGKESYQNVTGLFQVDEDGYYYYDARKNFAEFNKNSNSFTLYDGPAVWRTDAGWNEGTGAFDGDMSLGNYFPFDSASKVFDSIQTKDKDGNTTDILSSSDTITNVGNVVLANHYMGMTMQVDFTQPENGQLNMGASGRQDMVFQFSGDDDVWIFIDNVLVLDLGGIHSELYGTINFSTGEVITGQSWRTGGLPENPGNVTGDEETTLYEMFVKALGTDQADAIHWVTDDSGKKIFPTGTEHSLKLFYLERGNYDSSLQMRFNLQPPLSHSIKKVDQNGEALEGVEFELYAATATNGDSTDAADYQVTSGVIGTLATGNDGKSSFVRADGSPFSFTDRYHADGTLYYILKESKTVGGYRSLPKDIVLRFNPDTSMLIVANRYQTGAYASFFSNIREAGTLTYGQFDTVSGAIASSSTALGQSSKQNGLVLAVPMLLERGMSHDDIANDGKWQALYGSNTEGYGAVAPAARTAEAWRRAILKAALYQASDVRWPEWRLTYNQSTGRLEGLLEDLPGRADRYALYNEDGDMKMVYGILEPSALQKLGIGGNTSKELYDALEAYVSEAIKTGAQAGKSTEVVIDEIVEKLNIDRDNFSDRDFSFLNTDQFQREFRSTIYIPNERRELRVQKVDADGKGVNGVEFMLTAPDGSIITGTTATVDGQDGMLIFRPDAGGSAGYAQVAWEEVGSKYTLTEKSVPEGYERNETKIPVVVGIYSIYADAGTRDDGVTVMAGVGKLMQTMTKYAADDMVNITLRDITAIAQTQKSGTFEMDGWKDDLLAGTEIPRSMNLHYGVNAVVDYGLHDEDGGKNIYPFFTTDEGFLRTRVVQNTAALQDKLYEGSSNTANWDNLSGRDLTSLFSLLNTVVVTNQKTVPEDTGKLRVSKTVSGENLSDEDYTRNFTFTVSLKKADGTALEGEYYYYGEQRAGYIRDGGMLSLRHDEALTILGLPSGTKWKISEKQENGWSISPQSGVIDGVIQKDETANAAFINYKGNVPLGHLTVSKIVDGNAGSKQKDFHFTVTLNDTTVSGEYGDMKFANGVASFILKHGESKTADGLPEGIGYKVTEAEANQDGYATTSTGAVGTIGKDTMAEFTNTKNSAPPIDPKTGNLTVSKTVAGNAGDKHRDFTFTVLLGDTSISGTYGEIKFTSGVATFTLKHGESKTAFGLPVGITYTVTESEANQDGYTTSSTGASGAIEESGSAAAFLNTKDNTDPKTGSLIVSKTVSGSGGDTDKGFLFTVTLSDTSVNGKYGDMTFRDGVSTFTLKHGESVRAAGLPGGTRYTVSESDRAGYTATASGEAGILENGKTVTVLFNNHKNDREEPGNPDTPSSPGESPNPGMPAEDGPKTGDGTNVVLWSALSGISGMGMVAMLAISKRRYRKRPNER